MSRLHAYIISLVTKEWVHMPIALHYTDVATYIDNSTSTTAVTPEGN